MKLKIMCVYDSKVESYMQPFFMRSKGEALRGWETVVNDSKTQFYKYPADFTLFEVGEFDEETGNVITHPAKIAYGTALDFKKEDRQTTIEDVMADAFKKKTSTEQSLKQ